MNAGNHSGDDGDAPAADGFGVDDVFYTLFRHKWLVLSFVCLGLVAALVLRLVKPPLYQSDAVLSVPYVVDTKPVNTANPDTQITPTSYGGLAVIQSEIEILNSFDVCILVAERIGPEKILAKKGGGSNLLAAAGVIAAGRLVDPPRSTTISITFQHPDRELVQPVLAALIKAYGQQHRQVHSGEGVWDDLYIAGRDEWGKKLEVTEEQIRRIMSEAKIISVAEAKNAYQIDISKLQGRLLDAKMELAQRQAQLGNFTPPAGPPDATNATPITIPAVPGETIADYTAAVARLEYLVGYERKLLVEGLKEAHPWVQAARAERVERTEHKAALEQQYPALLAYAAELAGGTTNSAGGPTLNVGSPTNTAAAVRADVNRLTTNVLILNTLLSNVQFQAEQVMELEPRLTELQRQRNLQETNYLFNLGRVEQMRSGGSSGDGKMINMAVVQRPGPPYPNTKKMKKLIGMALGGCIALGLGLAFGFDLVLDRTLKRSTDVKRRLHLPVMLTIPHTNWSSGWCPAWLARDRPGRIQRYDPKLHPESPEAGAGMAPWNPVHHLREYTDGLRERLITYFEVNHLTHRPKLVALTSCGEGVGVTTLATGLAASLSMTGEGNVLLVDMNVGEGAAQSFHKGRPGCGLSQMPEPDDGPASASPNLALAAVPAGGSAAHDFARTFPGVFSDVMPDLKMNGYDYIVFDMPPVSQTSMTPRLSGHMDMVFLVIESEKTSQHRAVEASELMRGAQARVAAILNKCKAHVPSAISTGF